MEMKTAGIIIAGVFAGAVLMSAFGKSKTLAEAAGAKVVRSADLTKRSIKAIKESFVEGYQKTAGQAA
ncbi:MAG: hypothetical protein HQK83_13030 [Fibrobacteria bacterium]|nr:hypothetical protein [Fibrobacteria bacterium]